MTQWTRATLYPGYEQALIGGHLHTRPAMKIHLVQFGLVACEMEMPPAKWPEGHRWSSDLKDVTCDLCRVNATETPLTFEILENGKAIKCRICGAVSHGPRDIEHHFCGYCHVDHDNLWPPARKLMLEHPERYGIKRWPGAIK